MRNYKSLLFKSLIIGLMLSMCSVLAAGEMETIKKAAEQGDVEAQLKLGTMLRPRLWGD